MGDSTPKVCPVCATSFLDESKNQRRIFCHPNCGARAASRRRRGQPPNDSDQRVKPHTDPSWLHRMYIVEQRSVRQISSESGIAEETIRKYLANFDIPIRTASEVAILVARRGPSNPNWSGTRVCPSCGARKASHARTCVRCYSRHGSLNPKWRGDAVNYPAMHDRVKAARGSASLYNCADCGNPASEWSYDHCDPDERLDEDGPFSLHLHHYEPRCTPCHRRFDYWHARELREAG